MSLKTWRNTDDTSDSNGGESRAPEVCLAIPAYNEADGIAGFLEELDEVLHRETWSHRFVVVDDVSTDDTVEVLEKVGLNLHGELIAVPADRNRGHGPTVLTAYRRALASGADVIIQVDGDGQFEAEDLCLLLRSHAMGNEIVTGRRRSRVDPWFRKVVTLALRSFVRVGFGVKRADTNCPFRLYTSGALADVLTHVPPRAAVPHVYMTVLEARSGRRHEEVGVRHRVRRGDDATGTMWGTARPKMIPMRLVTFCKEALLEALAFRRDLPSSLAPKASREPVSRRAEGRA